MYRERIMCRKNGLRIIVAFALAFATSLSVAGEWEVSLGAAVNSSPLYTGSDEQELYIFPVVDATYHINRTTKFFAGSINGVGLEKALGPLVIGAGLGYRYGLYGPHDFGLLKDEPEELKGMHDPDDVETLHPYIKTLNDTWNAKLEYDQGLRGKNEGSWVKISGSYDYHLDQRMFGRIGIHTIWANKQFLDDYVGISREEINPDRREYIAEAGIYQSGMSAEINYLVDPQNVFFASVSTHWFGKDVQESYIVKTDVQPDLTFAYIHLF